MGSPKTSRVTAVAAAFAFSVLPLDSALSADPKTTLEVDIDSQPLEAALLELSKQGQLQLVISTGSLPAKSLVSLHGNMPLETALNSLLKDTGLTYKFVGDRTIAIVNPAASIDQLSELPGSPVSPGDASSGTPTIDDSVDGGAGNTKAKKGDNSMKHVSIISRLATLLGVCASVSGPGTVCAQQAGAIGGTDAVTRAAASDASGASVNQELAEIVVTAEKRPEYASRTPESLTVLTGAQLREAGVINLGNLGDSVPSLAIDRSLNGVNIFLRGVTTTDPQTAAAPGIGVNLDGVQIYQRKALAISLFDVDRLEVLSGPQGTLYGASSPGGVINIVTNRPQDTFHASADGEIGNYDARRGNFMINAPVSGWLDLRLALNANDRAGYLVLSPTGSGSSGPLVDGGNQALNAQHDESGRLSALFTFAAETTLLLQGTYGVVTGPSYGTVNLCSPLNAPNSCAINFTNESGEAQRSGWTNAVASSLDEHNSAVNAQFNTQFGGLQLTYSGGFDHYTLNDVTSDTGGVHGPFGPPGSPAYYFWNYENAYFNTVSNELRLSNAAPGRYFDWVVGISDLNVVVHEFSPGLELPINNPGTANQTFAPLQQSAITELPEGATDRSSVGAFAQATIHVADKVRITAGIRDSRDVVSKYGIQLNGPPGQCELANPAACNTIPDDGYASYDKFTWRAGVDYEPTAAQMLYASAATGYKPGGFNDPGNFHGAYGAVPYGSENLTAYELGYKFHDNDVSLTSDLYYYDYSDMQITAPEIGAANPFQPNVITTPTTLYGFESTLRWLVTPEDVISAGLTLEHSKYNSLEVANTNGPPNSPPINWAGQPVSLAPGVTVVLGYTRTWLLPDGASVRGHVGTKYTGAYYIDDINSGNAYPQSPFHRTDADLTYTTKNDHFFVTAFVTNLENKVQETFYQGPSCFQCGGSVGITQPMFYGLRVGVKE